MGLEHELVELNSAYQYSQQTVFELANRCQQLEQLARDYEALVEDMPDEGETHQIYLAWETRRLQLQQRAKALLNK